MRETIERSSINKHVWENPFVRDLYFGGTILDEVSSERRERKARRWAMEGPPSL